MAKLTLSVVGKSGTADFSDILGKWAHDPGSDEAIASQRQTDPEKWRSGSSGEESAAGVARPDVESRLRLFDQATARRKARTAIKAFPRATGRGWRRQDLY
jgi:hypothetical protein